MTYKPIYKCRMCGETFYGTPFTADHGEFGMITGMMANMGVANTMTSIIREHDMHPCMNGNAGYADLQGVMQDFTEAG